ncbi:MAG: tRNA pseudouridine(13) synthase TruD [Pseudomonadota bacterium]
MTEQKDCMTAHSADDTDLPFAFGGPAGSGRLRVEPEDFVVREIPICAPDGSGEHVWLYIRKRNANTEWVARQIARFAGAAPRDVSFAGLKDRRAVTEQWFSVQLPGRADPDWDRLEVEGVTVLQAARHSRKLRRGALRGNRFEIRVRGFDGDRALAEARLRALAARGVPNYFGTQRFGRDGGNLEAAARMLRGESRRPARYERGLYLSAARSHLFNQVLAARVAAGTWDTLLDGDVLQLDGGRAWFVADAGDAELPRRLQGMEVHPTGPLWGRGDPATQGAARALELACLEPWREWCAGLERAGLEQDRRALRVRAAELSWSWADESELSLAFALPSGSYATALLHELVTADGGEET